MPWKLQASEMFNKGKLRSSFGWVIEFMKLHF